MTVYLDSSALVKLYVPEVHSASVVEFVHSLKDPLLFSHLHEIEVKNAIRLKSFRKELSLRAAAMAIRSIEKDLTAQILIRPNLNWIDVFRKAFELSGRYSSRFGSRPLDLLHVATGLLIPCSDLVTFDERQATVAKKSGLHLVRLRGPHAPI
ncbi:MAG TPA: type II toxin-antitoxin system VapC family toxin [Terriglobia bacterium]|nr:type II toxin-antitoxin system VapC family toxin [Terriglobia bacterium]